MFKESFRAVFINIPYAFNCGIYMRENYNHDDWEKDQQPYYFFPRSCPSDFFKVLFLLVLPNAGEWFGLVALPADEANVLGEFFFAILDAEATALLFLSDNPVIIPGLILGL
jgi:hypothetical protein